MASLSDLHDSYKNQISRTWEHTPAGTANAADLAAGDFQAFLQARDERIRTEMGWLWEVFDLSRLRDSKVLELGFGVGFDALEMIRAGAIYTGIDFCENNCHRAESNVRQALPATMHKPIFLCGDAERVPVADSSQDFVFSNGVLHHTPDTEGTFREASRVLSKDGEFWVILYHRDSIFHWLHLFARDLRFGLAPETMEERLSRIEYSTTGGRPLVKVYSRPELSRMLSRSGFQVQDLQVRKLVWRDFPWIPLLGHLVKRIPQPFLDFLSRNLGWYVAARAIKKEEPAPRRLTAIYPMGCQRDSAPPWNQSDYESITPSDLRDTLMEPSNRGLSVRGINLNRLRDLRGSRDSVVIMTPSVRLLPKPLEHMLAAWHLAPRQAWIWGQDGSSYRITPARLALQTYRFLRDKLFSSKAGQAVERLTEQLGGKKAGHNPVPRPCHGLKPDFLKGRALYLRTDLAFGIKSGGAIAHVTGVANNLQNLFSQGVTMLTTAPFPGLSNQVDQRVITPEQFWNLNYEKRSLLFNLELIQRGLTEIRDASKPPVTMIYQRYSLNNITGAILSAATGIPLVAEYNGSEIWVAGNWGKGLADAETVRRAELAFLKTASLVVVVSEPLKAELMDLGISGDRILVNPNGVDPQVYSPQVDSSARRLQLLGSDPANTLLIGFIGTFGMWHGAEFLVSGFLDMLKESPEKAGRMKLVMMGDGITRQAAQSLAEASEFRDRILFTGLIPQQLGPEHLNSCDILVAPHVPNPDGTPFFGSPTKLFEYMATGRAVAASALGQIGSILEQEKDALLFQPGDSSGLVKALTRLSEDSELRLNLGRNARDKVMRLHTWEQHTRRILQTLQELNGSNHKTGSETGDGPCQC